MTSPLGLYIHIPYCRRTCFYCHFTRYPWSAKEMSVYLKGIGQEIKLRETKDYRMDSVYIGGGSPSLLSPQQMADLLEQIHGSFHLSDNAEISMEANPEDLALKKLKEYRRAGVNRISLGVQSFIQEDLDYLQRAHGIEGARKAIEESLEAGFKNINLDFIISLPTQNKTSLEENFSLLERFPIPHVSMYILEGLTPSQADETRDHTLYYHGRKLLQQRGYIQYEISNFSKDSHTRCRHNLKYWQSAPYLGIGASACGYFEGMDYKNTENIEAYLSEPGQHPPGERMQYDPTFRQISTGLRLREGVPRSAFINHEEELKTLISRQILTIDPNDRIAINPDKILVLNEVLTRFAPD